jgi:hypothetical protein
MTDPTIGREFGLAPVVDHPTRRTRHFRTLKSTLGRSERDVLVRADASSARSP